MSWVQTCKYALCAYETVSDLWLKDFQFCDCERFGGPIGIKGFREKWLELRQFRMQGLRIRDIQFWRGSGGIQSMKIQEASDRNECVG